MFKKVLLSLLMVGVAFVTGYATAQSYYMNNAPASASGDGSAGSSSSSPPSDFQSQVQQQQDQKNQALSDQLKQELAKVPPTPAPSSTPAIPDAGTPQGTETTTPDSGQAPSAAAPTAQPPAAEATPTGPTTTNPAATPPSQSQVYTGFQNPGQNTSPTPAPGPQQNQPAQQSGGWNIKY